MVKEGGVLLVWVVLLLGLAASAFAATRRVSDLKALHEWCEAKAQPGDVIEIQPGTHYLDARFVHVLRSGEPGKPITIRGVVRDGRTPVLDGSKVNVDRGLFRLEQGTHDIVFEDLELCNAKGTRFPDQRSYGYNAGGIYFQGDHITARRLHVHHNEMGLFATHVADHIIVENCEVDHNGTQSPEGEGPTHNFYFSARHQIVRNCYIHHSVEAQNFKSRGGNTILAYNWIEEDAGYSVEVASDNDGNTLWIGNIVIKRAAPGWMRRILGVGDGVDSARGTLTLINNTIISTQPDDRYLFTQAKAICSIVLINNVFAGPSTQLLDLRGTGTITGRNNWFQRGMEVPDTITDSILGDDPGFISDAAGDYRPRPGSPLRGAGLARPQYLNGDQQLEAAVPEYEPAKAVSSVVKRAAHDGLDIGAFAAR
jgi:hypothetical protein